MTALDDAFQKVAERFKALDYHVYFHAGFFHGGGYRRSTFFQPCRIFCQCLFIFIFFFASSVPQLCACPFKREKLQQVIKYGMAFIGVM